MDNDYEFLFRRRHPFHRDRRTTWEHCAAAYRGGGEYVARTLIRHVSEIELEFAERLRRAYYFNYPRKLARLITQCVLSTEPQRSGASAEIAEDFSRSGLRVDEVMRQFSTLLNVFGAAALCVEMPYFEGDVDCERKRIEKLRPAARAVSPLDVADWSFGGDGELDWILLEESPLLDRGPFLPPHPVKRRRLLTRDECLLFEEESPAGKITLLRRMAHRLGRVPALLRMEPDGFAIDGGHYFDDVVRISDAILNNESEAQMNVVKQMFGLLVISESFARSARGTNVAAAPGTGEKFSHALSRSAALWESPEERGISRYISPSGVESSTIRNENEALKRELFDVVGMGLVNQCREAQTAESKAWDYLHVKQFLSGRADLLEQSELQCWRLMAAFDSSIRVPAVCYNRDFSVTDLKSSIESLTELKRFSGGNEYRREIARTALFLLEKLKKVSPESRESIMKEIENWQMIHPQNEYRELV